MSLGPAAYCQRLDNLHPLQLRRNKAPTVRYGNDEALSGRYSLLKEEVEVTEVLELVAPLNTLSSLHRAT